MTGTSTSGDYWHGGGLLMLALCAGLFWYARRTHSYWFLVLAAVYAYFWPLASFVQLYVRR